MFGFMSVKKIRAEKERLQKEITEQRNEIEKLLTEQEKLVEEYDESIRYIEKLQKLIREKQIEVDE